MKSKNTCNVVCVSGLELSTPSKEQLALQAELRRLETARRLDEDEFETQKNIFYTQLQHEVCPSGI